MGCQERECRGCLLPCHADPVRQPHSDACWPRRERHAGRSLSLSGRAKLFLFSFLWGSRSSVSLFIFGRAWLSSPTKDRTQVLGSEIPSFNHWTSGEFPLPCFRGSGAPTKPKAKRKNVHPMYIYENILPCFDPSGKKVIFKRLYTKPHIC